MPNICFLRTELAVSPNNNIVNIYEKKGKDWIKIDELTEHSGRITGTTVFHAMPSFTSCYFHGATKNVHRHWLGPRVQSHCNLCFWSQRLRLDSEGWCMEAHPGPGTHQPCSYLCEVVTTGKQVCSWQRSSPHLCLLLWKGEWLVIFWLFSFWFTHRVSESKDGCSMNWNFCINLNINNSGDFHLPSHQVAE